MKIAELTGGMLDLWVAKSDPRCEGLTWEQREDHWAGVYDGDVGAFITDRGPVAAMRLRRKYDNVAEHYAPSTNWQHGGPIIERENIQLGPPTNRVHRNGGPNSGWGESGVWSACTWHNGANGRRSIAHHETSPLIAAMRCYVASKYGEEVPEVEE